MRETMNIWVFVDHFHLDDGVPATRWNRLCRELANQGVKVTCFCREGRIKKECDLDGVYVVPVEEPWTWEGVFKTTLHKVKGALKGKAGPANHGTKEGTDRYKALVGRGRYGKYLENTARRILDILDFPDTGYKWGKNLLHAAFHRLDQKPDLVIASLPGSGGARAAKLLFKKAGIPYILDFRDPWSRFYWSFQPEWMKRKKHAIEKQLVESASGVVYLNKKLSEYVEGQARARFFMPNGFVGGRSQNWESALLVTERDAAPNAVVRLVYTGSMGAHRIARMEQLLDYLIEMNAEVAGRKVELHYYGNSGPRIQASLDTRDALASDFFKDHGEVSYEKSLAVQKEASILINTGIISPMANCVQTGKIFEYMEAKRPVINIDNPEYEMMRTVMEDVGVGRTVDTFEDFRHILESYALSPEKFYKDWLECRDEKSIETYAISSQATSLRGFIGSLISS